MCTPRIDNQICAFKIVLSVYYIAYLSCYKEDLNGLSREAELPLVRSSESYLLKDLYGEAVMIANTKVRCTVLSLTAFLRMSLWTNFAEHLQCDLLNWPNLVGAVRNSFVLFFEHSLQTYPQGLFLPCPLADSIGSQSC